MRFLLLMLFAGCISCSSSVESAMQESVLDSVSNGVAGNWYRQYAGTVAGQPVVVQLHKYGNQFHGAYYYTSRGQILNLLPDEGDGDSLKLSEQAMTEENDWENSGSWTIVIKNDSLTGAWADGQRKTKHSILLRETSPAGSIELDVRYLKDSAKLNERQTEYTVFASYQFLVSAKLGEYPHKAFVDSALHGAIGCKAGETDNCLRIKADDYFRGSRDELIDLDSSEHVSHDEQLNTWVLFNADGWLVLESFSFSYMGGAHGNYGSGFLNLDLQSGKLWKLGDVIAGDTARLKPLLTEAARKYFKLKPGEKLSGRLLMLDAPTVTDNFYITPRGLAFVYNPYEITPYATGMITLFIPYEKLSGMLTPEFSARMNKK